MSDLNTLRKRKSRLKENSDHIDCRRTNDKMNKRAKRANETEDQRKDRLSKQRERYHKKKANRVLGTADERLNRFQSQGVDDRLSELDRNLLQGFRVKINNISNNLCPVCNE